MDPPEFSPTSEFGPTFPYQLSSLVAHADFFRVLVLLFIVLLGWQKDCRIRTSSKKRGRQILHSVSKETHPRKFLGRV